MASYPEMLRRCHGRRVSRAAKRHRLDAVVERRLLVFGVKNYHIMWPVKIGYCCCYPLSIWRGDIFVHMDRILCGRIKSF